jgi:hypothetical protein
MPLEYLENFVARFTATGASLAARRIEYYDKSVCLMAENVVNEEKLLTLWTI